MKIEVNVSNKVFYLGAGVLILLGLAFFGFAYGTSNPKVFGHSAGEIGPGSFAEGVYSFPGSSKVGIGKNNPSSTLDVVGNSFFKGNVEVEGFFNFKGIGNGLYCIFANNTCPNGWHHKSNFCWVYNRRAYPKGCPYNRGRDLGSVESYCCADLCCNK